MFPKTPEIVVIFIICVAIFGLGKLDDLGELAWRIRCRLSPSLDPNDTGGMGDAPDENRDDSDA